MTIASTPADLLALSTAQAPHVLWQAEAVQVAERMFEGRFSGWERMRPVFDSAGIDQRQTAMPIDWYLEPRGWTERTAAYLEVGTDLFVAAAQGALAEAGLSGGEVDVIVTLSSTGIATPSLEARASGRLGFRPDAARVPVFGLGCAGGATGLALAARLAGATPGAVVLLVVVELCTLSFRSDDLGKADIVATALFGDGAAACVLRSGAGGGFARTEASAEHTWPDPLDVMGWRVDPTGLGVIFDRAIPPFARNRLRPAVEEMLAGQARTLDDIDRFICHPGGMKVIDALESSLKLQVGSLDHERAVLRDHGNMSAPTVLHVLDRARRAGLPPCSVVLALGPGFTCSTVTLEALA